MYNLVFLYYQNTRFFMKSNRSFLIVLMIFLSALTVNAVTYYVSPTGSSATGTVNSPMSLSAALSKSLAAGDSLVFRGGTYLLSANIRFNKTGTSVAKVAYVAYPNEVPVFDFRSQPYNSNNIGISVTGDYIKVKGLVVQGAGDNGMQVTGSYNEIENCVFRWNCDSGLQLKTGSNNTVVNCDSYDNFDYKSMNSNGTPNYGGNADGFADKQYTNTGTNVFRGCRAWNNADDAWDHYEKIGNTEYYDCMSFYNGPASFDMTNHIRFKTDSASWFYQFKNSEGKYIMTNYGNGNGFKLGGNYTAHNAKLYNCVAVGNPVKGFDQNNNNGTMTLYNCTGYLNNPDYGFSNSSYGTLLVKNSVSYGSKSTNKLASKTVTQSHNSWLSGFSATAVDFVSLDVAQLYYSRNADGSLPVTTLLHLKQGSGLIDKGTNVGLVYYGAAPDLGAYEYQSTTGDVAVENINIVNYIKASEQIIVTGDVAGLSVYNLQGQMHFKGIGSPGKTVVSTSLWPKGIYLIKFTLVNGVENSSKVFVF